MTDELGRIWKEVVMAYMRYILTFSRETEKLYKKNQSIRDSAYIQTKHLPPHTILKNHLLLNLLYNKADLLRMTFKMGWGEKKKKNKYGG
jgi:hypothetical protein